MKNGEDYYSEDGHWPAHHERKPELARFEYFKDLFPLTKFGEIDYSHLSENNVWKQVEDSVWANVATTHPTTQKSNPT